jgi:citrate:succinate antiporter/L-tartrate/succinate antiporter
MFDSYPDKDSRKIGAYLAWCALAATCVSSSIFLTGQAPNPLALEVAAKSGVVTVDWMGWFIAVLPVSIILFLATPILIYYIYPPEIKRSPEVEDWARKEYTKLGDISNKEIFMLAISILALSTWICSDVLKIHATATAMVAIILMFATGIITWEDFIGHKAAWNVLTWFATLVTMADGLRNVGFLSWTAKLTEGYLQTMSPFWAMIMLVLAYYFLHYFFASGTAHVTALLGLFIVVAKSVPGMDVRLAVLLMLLPMGFMGVLTPYGTGHSPVWFASGYVTGPAFWRLGAIFGVLYMIVYLLVGVPWVMHVAYKWVF